MNILLLGEKGIGKKSFVVSAMKKYASREDIRDSCIAGSEGAYSGDNVDADILSLSNVLSFQDLKLCFYSVPSFSSKLGSALCMVRIGDEIENRHMQWSGLSQLLTEGERLLADERIHCVLYFLSPHGIKDVDIQAISALSSIANVVPVIGKADSLTPQEKQEYLTKIHDLFCSRGDTSIAFRFDEDPRVSLREQAVESCCEEKCEPVDAPGSSDEGLQHAHELEDSGIALIRSFENFDAGDSDVFAASLSRIGRQQFSAVEQLLPTPCSPAPSATSEDGSPFRVPDAFALITDPSGFRNYSWGVIRVDNPFVSDFIRLQRLLFEDGRTIVKMRRATQQKTVQLVLARQRQQRLVCRGVTICVALALLAIGASLYSPAKPLGGLLRGDDPAVATAVGAAPPEGTYSSGFHPLTGHDLVRFLFAED